MIEMLAPFKSQWNSLEFHSNASGMYFTFVMFTGELFCLKSVILNLWR